MVMLMMLMVMMMVTYYWGILGYRNTVSHWLTGLYRRCLPDAAHALGCVTCCPNSEDTH